MAVLDLRNKVVLITGGSAGIGLAVAQRMVREGAKVALVARTRDKLEAAARELGAAHAAAFPLDVNDRAAVDALPGQVRSKLGGLDVLVNNAGLHYRGPAMTRTAAELAATIETNLTAVVYLTRVVLDHLRAGGGIVNVSSLNGKVPTGSSAAYSASKAGLRAFSMALREELGPRDIRVVCVNPGPVDTDFFGDLREASNLTFSQPMSTPDEVADVVIQTLVHDIAEADLPMLSGKLATLGYLFPGLKKALRPMLERRGAAAKERLMRRRGQL